MGKRKTDIDIEDGSKVFFTSDTHFNHKNIIGSCHRPFSSVEEMNKAIIDNWNEKVPTDALVFHLGDFAWGSNMKLYEDLIGSLNGRIILVKGNHDEKNLPKNTARLLELFEGITNQIYCLIEGRYVYMNHYPFLCYGGVYREDNDKVYQLFGHCHYGKIQTGLDMPRAKFLLPTQYDVGIDNNDYTPISWNEVDEKIKEQIKTDSNMTMWWKNNESNEVDE